MPPLPTLDAATQRSLLLLVPWLGVFIAFLITQPSRRFTAGLFLATLWNFIFLFAVNLLAAQFDWWQFHADKNLVLHLPWDVLLGWALWWGAFLPLVFKGKYWPAAFCSALWIDLLCMPRLMPLIELGPHWLVGEACVMLLCLLPGWLIVVTTAKDIHVGWRAAAQAVMTGALLIVLLPQVVLNCFGRDLLEILDKTPWQVSLLFNTLMIPVILGLSGNQEFATRGKGTPIPFDPPKHLVVTGPYAFVGNPMQISIVLILLVLAGFYHSLALAGAALVSVIYCLGVVRWHHTIDMAPRFGAAWTRYKQHVRDWLPRWRPWIAQSSTVYFAQQCEICSGTEHWLRKLDPIGLDIRDITAHPGPITRVTYRYPDGGEVSGIAAIAACLNHTNVALAFFGWFMRLPIICQVLQIVIDGCGERAVLEHCPQKKPRG